MKHFPLAIVVLLMAGCQYLHHGEHQSTEIPISYDTIASHTIVPVNPNAKLKLKYKDHGQGLCTDLELRFDKIYYKDTTHYFEYSDTKYSSLEECVLSWSNGLHSAFIIPIQYKFLPRNLLLLFEGNTLCNTLVTPKPFFLESNTPFFLNDIDEDGCVEYGLMGAIGYFPLSDADSIPISMYNTKLGVWKVFPDTTYLDEQLSTMVHELIFIPFKDTIFPYWDEPETLYQTRIYLDFNNNTILELSKL